MCSKPLDVKQPKNEPPKLSTGADFSLRSVSNTSNIFYTPSVVYSLENQGSSDEFVKQEKRGSPNVTFAGTLTLPHP